MTNEQPIPPFLPTIQSPQHQQNGFINSKNFQKALEEERPNGNGGTEGDAKRNRKTTERCGEGRGIMDGQQQMEEEEFEGGRSYPHIPVVVERRKKKPYKELTLEEKVQLIRLAERCTNLSQANIAEKYEIAKSNVCRILQRKEEYIRALESAGFSGSRKRKLRALEPEEGGREMGVERRRERGEKNEEEPHNTWAAAQVEMGGGGGGEEEEGRRGGGGGEEDNEALRAHMASEHKSGRMFLCRCCNWAFRDKNELHRHLKSRRASERPNGTMEEGLAKVEEKEEKGQQIIASIGPNTSAFRPNLEEAAPRQQQQPPPISLADGLQRRQQHLLMANLWNNILLGQHRLSQNWTGGNRAMMEEGGGQGQLRTGPELALLPNQPIAAPAPSVIVQNGAGTNHHLHQHHSLAAPPIGPSPSDSDSELTIISSSSNSSSSSSSHNNSQTISPSQSSSGQSSSSSSASIQNSGTDMDHPNGRHVSPPECGQCALMKPKLTLAQARSSYLEVYNATFQNELVHLNAKCLLAEQCIRALEVELRQWRDRNDLLRYRLLECREKAIGVIQQAGGGGGNGTAAVDVNKFVGEMLKITLV